MKEDLGARRVSLEGKEKAQGKREGKEKGEGLRKGRGGGG